MHEDFNKKHYPFKAGFKRDGKEAQYIDSCTTIAGFLCKLSSKKVKGQFINEFSPIWDGLKDKEELAKRGFSMQFAIENYSEFLIKFGKVDGEYWCWNEDAKERRQLEENKIVYIYYAKSDPLDDECDDCRLKMRNYPPEVKAIMKPFINEVKRFGYYEVGNLTLLNEALEKIGWKTFYK